MSLDGAIFPMKQCEALKTRLAEKKIKVDINLEDRLIMDHSSNPVEPLPTPSHPALKVYKLKDKRSPLDKVHQIFNFSDPYSNDLQKSLTSQGIQGIFISKVEEVNWLLNLRALGVHHYDPLFNAIALALCSDGGECSIHVFVENQETMEAV